MSKNSPCFETEGSKNVDTQWLTINISYRSK